VEEKIMVETHDEYLLEQLYWEFDTSRKTTDERTAFKNKLRWYAEEFHKKVENIK
jgi:hypothetical protein